MEDNKIKLKSVLWIGILAAGAYYLAGPVGLGVVALFVLLKKF